MEVGEVSSGEMVAGTVTAGTVSSGEMVAGTVTAGTVSSGEMVAGTVSSGEMVAGTVNSGEMVAGEMSTDPLWTVTTLNQDYKDSLIELICQSLFRCSEQQTPTPLQLCFS